MDLSTVTATNKVVEILHPATEERIGLRITLLPPTDKKVKKVQRANLDRQLKARKGKMTAAQIEASNFDVLVASVDEWEWYGEDVNFEGDKPDCTEENVRRVLDKVSWIRSQVREAFDEEEGFFAA
jgi:hypothetical protein